MKRFPLSLTSLTLVCALLSGVCLTVQAQEASSPRVEQARTELQKRFAAADSNADGRLTRDEAQGKLPRVHRHFEAIDTDKAGSVSLEQIEAFATRQRSRR